MPHEKLLPPNAHMKVLAIEDAEQTASTLMYSTTRKIGELQKAARGILEKLAAATGGEAYIPNSFVEVINVCRVIATDIRHQYTVAYNPPDSARPGYRKIHVSASAPGHGKLVVRARAGYFLSPKTPTPTEPSDAGGQHP